MKRRITTPVSTWLSELILARNAILSACLVSLISACSNLPNSGPRADAYDSAQTRYETPTSGDEAEEAKLPFVLVDVDRRVLKALLSTEDPTYFKGAFTDRTQPSSTPLGVGDVLRITIFESGPGGLFIQQAGGTNGGNYITLPDQEVDQTGSISVPYAGKGSDNGVIKVSGKTAAEVQHEIQKRLLNKAIEPQVILTVVKRTSNLYSVIGDVNAPGRYNIDQAGVRVLDALGAAGGPKSSDYNTLITLQRGATSATVRLSTILKQSDNNIFVQPNDLLAIKRDERYYNVLGAMHNNNRIPFETETVTVADAIAKAGGLDMDNAEPSSVVVFRREDSKVLEAAGVKLEGLKTDELVPTVYRFDLRTPGGMFLAQKMQLHGDDAVYVSKHTLSDVKLILTAVYDALLISLIKR